MYRPIDACRICRGRGLEVALELGEQSLTGFFPKSESEEVPRGPLTLGRCPTCGLVQLMHSYDPAMLYGPSYGYRSGLNRSMVEHLRIKAAALQKLVALKPGDAVIDIGSNDGTTLSFYPDPLRLVGFDPSAEPFRKYYKAGISLITDFFSAARFRDEFGHAAKARLISSLAMFYDLEDPLAFVREIESILADDGVWHFEQSYLPLMLETNAYDTVCHEHLEYYALKQIKWMTDKAGLKILDVALNDVNGGSFAITVTKQAAPYPENSSLVSSLLKKEESLGLDRAATYTAFEDRVLRHRETLLERLHQLHRAGKRVLGYGASTKGNVLLQYCGIDRKLIPCIAEVNQNKFGSFTPGTRIPIVSEADAKAQKPDCFLVLPWHFKTNLVERESEYLRGGGRMLFPLPNIEEVTH